MIKKYGILLALWLFASPLQSYLIIWDLGDTLLYVSILNMVTHIGMKDCALYHIFHTKEKQQLQNLLFDVLEEFGGKQAGEPDEQSYHTAHRALPQVMCDWLAGRITEPQKLIEQIHKKLRQLRKQDYFKNDLEYKIVKNAIAAMFTPGILIQSTHILKGALEIVQEIAQSGQHQQTILSNWDGVSYENFKASPAGQELSRYFDMDSVIISGYIGYIKPHPDIFNYTMSKYNTTPENCIFIDDQKENVEAARKLGLNAIHIKHHDFKQLRKDLIALDVL